MDSNNTQQLSKYALRSPLMKNSLKKTKTRSNSEYNSKTRKVRTLESSNSYPGNNPHNRRQLTNSISVNVAQAAGSNGNGANSSEDEDFMFFDQLVQQLTLSPKAGQNSNVDSPATPNTTTTNACNSRLESIEMANMNMKPLQHHQPERKDFSYEPSQTSCGNITTKSSTACHNRRQLFERKRSNFALSSVSSMTSSQDSGVCIRLSSSGGSTDDSNTTTNAECGNVATTSFDSGVGAINAVTATSSSKPTATATVHTAENSQQHSQPQQQQQQKQQKPTLARAISNNLEKLAQLTAEFNFLNKDLSFIVKEEHRLIGLGEEGEVEEFSAYLQELGYLNMTAQCDIQRAYLAYMDYIATATELKEAIEMEEARILEKAYKLDREDVIFNKVHPEAIAKMRQGVVNEQPPLQTSF